MLKGEGDSLLKIKGHALRELTIISLEIRGTNRALEDSWIDEKYLKQMLSADIY